MATSASYETTSSARLIFEGAAPVEPHDAEGASEAAAGEVDLEVAFNVAKQQSVNEFERRYLTALLDWARGNVTRAAQKAKMDRMNLHRLVQVYGLRAGRSVKD